MEILEKELKELINKMQKRTKKEYNLSEESLNHLYSVYPFNKFEYVLSHLIATNTINLDQYLEIRDSYLRRNKYLYVFEITAPRTFGETWAQRHLNEVVPELEIPSKEFDKEYSGQYDFWYKGIRIEVKASRAVKRESGETLLEKALSSDSKSSFDMNFQQIKPGCCDIFIWIGVWRDKIRYWVLTSEEVQNNQYYSRGQHRGNVGEGQLWMKDSNISEFDKYEVGVRDILNTVVEKYNKMKKDESNMR